MLKIINCATIKETKKLKETIVGVKMEFAGDHQYPLGSIRSGFGCYGHLRNGLRNEGWGFLSPKSMDWLPQKKIILEGSTKEASLMGSFLNFPLWITFLSHCSAAESCS